MRKMETEGEKEVERAKLKEIQMQGAKKMSEVTWKWKVRARVYRLLVQD
jgi:hypothetical protein